MRSSSKDALFVLINLVVLFFFSWMLYSDFSQRIEKTDGVRLGTITFKKRVAERKYSDQVIWETIAESSILYDNDSLRTADGAEAVVLLDDGTRIELGEETLILLARSGRGLSIDFRQGSLAAKAGDASTTGFEAGSATNIEIKSGNTALALGTADATLNKKKGQTGLVIDVTRGTAVVDQAGSKVEVKENEQAVIDSSKATARVRKAALVPIAGGLVLTTDEKAAVRFAWTGNDDPVKLVIGRDAALASPLMTQEVDGSSATLELASGTWYWRVQGTDNEVSRTERTVVLQAVKPQPLQPVDDAVISYHAAQPLIRFLWLTDDSASGYDIEIARDAGFSSISARLQSRTGAIATDGLAAGEYWWRVTARHAVARGAKVTGRPARFVIKKREAPPVLAVPAAAASVSTVQLATKQAAISWQGDPEFARYRVEVAKTADFAEIVHREETSVNFSRMSPSVPAGQYYWRVTGIDQQGQAVASSQVSSIEVRNPQPPVLITPATEAMFTVAADKLDIVFSWQDPNRGGKARLELARDAGFAPIEQTQIVTGNSARISLGQGDWWWRVTLLDQAGGALATPATARFVISQALALPRLVQPPAGAEIDMSRANSIVFEWDRVEAAQAYEFSLFSYRGAVLQKVYETRVEATRYVFGQLDKLDRGNFVWEVVALALENGRVKTRSKPARGGFTVKLPELKKPVIITPGVIYSD